MANFEESWETSADEFSQNQTDSFDMGIYEPQAALVGSKKRRPISFIEETSMPEDLSVDYSSNRSDSIEMDIYGPVPTFMSAKKPKRADRRPNNDPAAGNDGMNWVNAPPQTRKTKSPALIDFTTPDGKTDMNRGPDHRKDPLVEYIDLLTPVKPPKKASPKVIDYIDLESPPPQMASSSKAIDYIDFESPPPQMARSAKGARFKREEPTTTLDWFLAKDLSAGDGARLNLQELMAAEFRAFCAGYDSGKASTKGKKSQQDVDAAFNTWNRRAG